MHPLVLEEQGPSHDSVVQQLRLVEEDQGLMVSLQHERLAVHGTAIGTDID